VARIIQRPGKPGGGYVRLLAGLSFFAVTWISVVGMFRLLTSLSASQSWPAHLTADGSSSAQWGPTLPS